MSGLQPALTSTNVEENFKVIQVAPQELWSSVQPMVCGEPLGTFVYVPLGRWCRYTVVQQQLALHFPGAFVVTITVNFVSPSLVMDFAVFSHISTRLFLCAKSFFVPRKNGILYFITLRSVGFRWNPWHVDSHSVLLARSLVVISCIAVCGSPPYRCFRRYHRPYPRSNFMMPSVRRPQVLTPRLYPVNHPFGPRFTAVSPLPLGRQYRYTVVQQQLAPHFSGAFVVTIALVYEVIFIFRFQGGRP